jgi:hypothetical protein
VVACSNQVAPTIKGGITFTYVTHLFLFTSPISLFNYKAR